MASYHDFERKLEEPMRNTQLCSEYLRVLRSLALNHPEPSASLLKAHLEYTQDIVSTIAAGLEEIKRPSYTVLNSTGNP